MEGLVSRSTRSWTYLKFITSLGKDMFFETYVGEIEK